MATGGLDRPYTDGRWDFFISYTARDRAWAEWIAWQLEAADFRVLVQAWDMVAGSNWSAAMQDGIRYSTRTLAVLSAAYLESVYGEQEWQAAFVADPDGAARRLLPVRIENCARPGVLGSRVSVDLFGLAAHGARDVLLHAVQAAISGRAKPPAEPHFPGGGPIPPKAPTARRAPFFPGFPDGPSTALTGPSIMPASAAPPTATAERTRNDPSWLPAGARAEASGGSQTAPPMRAEPETPGECRALLIGVPGYDDEGLPPLPWLAPLMDATAESLERVGYRADVHDRSRLGLSAIKSAIHAFLRDAAPDDTLLLVLAGHGVHHDGRDFLVPADADLGYQPFWDLCVPLDWARTISRSAAGRVLVIVDAAADLADDEVRAAMTEDGWAEGRLPAAEGTEVAYLIRQTRSPGVRSPLLRALVDVLASPVVPGDLRILEEALRRRLALAGPTDSAADGPVSLAGAAGAAGAAGVIDPAVVADCVAGSASPGGAGVGSPPCALRLVLYCDPREFRPFPAAPSAGSPASPEHPWRRAADRHAAWTLMGDGPAAEELRAQTIDLVARLGIGRDRAAAGLNADPWLDQTLALRLMKRIEFLVRRLPVDPPPLSPAEAGLLVAVPFLHEALWTTLVARASVAHPAGSDRDGWTAGRDVERTEFENFTRLHPRLLRRIDRARRAGDTGAAEAIGWWLAHRWVARRPESYTGPVLAGLLAGVDPETPAGDVFTAARASALLTAVRADPAYLNRPGQAAALLDLVTVAPATGDEMTLRERFVGYLLTIGQRMALEPAALPDVIVEHLGVGDPVDLGVLGETIRQAQWQHRGRSGRALSARCQHQAVQVALERHTTELDSLLAEAHRVTGEIPALAHLPTHATADAVRAVEVDGQPAYSSAGAQFRLAEDKVQELLMGEQLYTNRGLAIRELYQNALDACRYRRAREEYLARTTGRVSPWTGRISFTQGFEPDGGAYLECHDNGIGMGLRELTDVFAEAGTRSVDLPEVIEEMVAWKSCDPPIEFHPNSRFGVGVLSYFMIADEITIETCRLGLDGRPGDRFRVIIAGPGNLFRVQNLGPGAAAGTSVRLHLSRGAGQATVSCVDLLRRILWVAEFETQATEGVARAHWSPGELADFAPVGDVGPLDGLARRWTSPIVPAGEGVWWANGRGALLADGLWVGQIVFGVVVNLTGRLAPELSVDRNEIRELVDEPAVDERLAAAVPRLLAAGAFELTYEWLSSLARHFPLVADVILAALLAGGARTWPTADGAAVPMDRVGCFPLDGELLPTVPRQQLDINTGYWYLPDALVFRRLAVWATATRPGPPPESRSVPSDLVLAGMLNVFLLAEPPRELSVVLFLAGRLRRPPDEIHRRIGALGLGSWSGKATTVSAVTRGDLVLLSAELDGGQPLLLPQMPLGHAVLAAQSLGLGLGEVVRRLRELGLEIFPAGTGEVDLLALDLVLLSTDLTGRAPWLSRDRVPLAHVLRAALHTGLTIDALSARLRTLGHRAHVLSGVSATPFEQDDVLLFNADDRDALAGWPVPVGFVLLAAVRTARSPREVARRLAALGLPAARTSHLPAAVDAFEPELVEADFSRDFRQAGVPVSRIAVLRTAQQTATPPEEVITQLRGLGFTVAELAGTDLADARMLIGGDGSGLRRLAHGDRVGLVDVLGLAGTLGLPAESVAGLFDRVGIATPDLIGFASKPEDAVLFSYRLDGAVLSLARDRGDAFPVAQLLAAAARLGRSPAELAERVRYLGVAVPDPTGWDASPLATEDVRLLSHDAGLDGPWLPAGTVSSAHLLRVAAATGRSPGETARRLGDLGFRAGPVPETALTAAEDRVLTALLSPAKYWSALRIWTEPTRAGLLAVARLSGRAPSDLARWLRGLGLRPDAMTVEPDGVVPWDRNLDVDVTGDDLDLDLLSRDVDGQAPWLTDGAVPTGHVLAVAGLTGRRPADLVDTLRRLGFATADVGREAATGYAGPAAVDAVDVVLLSRDLNGESPWLAGGRLPRAHLLHAACVLGCDVAEVRERYARLGFAVPDRTQEMDRVERAAVTVAFYRADTADPQLTPVSSATTLGVAEFTGRAPGEVAQTFAGLGLRVDHDRLDTAVRCLDPRLDPDGTALTGLTARDVLLLSARLDGCGPWLGRGPVPLAHVIGAAGYLRWTPGRVADRLAALGCHVPMLVDAAREAFIDGVDGALVDLLRDHQSRHVDRAFSRAEVLVASWRYRWTPRRIADRLAELGFAVPARATFDR
ncbi:TIR domain-containing protein [Frankia sp. ArI3]|uniref:wHTH domain-containing protein n=1 Tax=Frankia sp. ArI3 TaxID=1858 RepID=UPI00210234A7|nr:TIR domain-containing protein [Frankia sp. ArI3]